MVWINGEYYDDATGSVGLPVDPREKAFQESALSNPWLSFGAHAINNFMFGFGLPLITYLFAKDEQEAKLIRQNHDYAKTKNPIASGLGSILGFGGSLLAGGPAFKALGKAGQVVGGAIRGGAEAGAARRAAAFLGQEVTEGALGGALFGAPETLQDFNEGKYQEGVEHLVNSTIMGGLLQPALVGGAKALASGVKKGISTVAGSKSLEQFADDQILNSLFAGGNKKGWKKIDEVGEKDVVNFFKRNPDLARQMTGKTKMFAEDFDQVLGRVKAYKNEIGSDKANIFKQLDAMGVSFDANDVASVLEKEVLQPLSKFRTSQEKSLYRQVKREIDTFKASYKDEPLMNFSEMWNYRRKIDEMIAGSKNDFFGNVTPFGGELKKTRAMLNQIVDNKVKELDDNLYQEIKMINKDYQVASTVETILQNSKIQEMNNKTFGLTDWFSLGSASVHPLGVLVPFVKHWIEHNGKTWLANKRLESIKLGDVVKQASKDAADQQVSKFNETLKDLFSNKKPKAQALGHTLYREYYNDDKFNQLVDNINQAALAEAENPIQQASYYISGSNPHTAQALNAQSIKVLKYLAGAAPKKPTPAPFQKPKGISAQEKQDYLDKVAIVKDPYQAAELLKSGRLNKNHVDALKNTAPNILAKMQSEVLQKGFEPGSEKIPFNRKLQLALVLQEPSIHGINVAAWQQTYDEQQAQSGGARKGTKQIKLPASQYSEIQKMENGLPA